jgi:hypothetical protein
MEKIEIPSCSFSQYYGSATNINTILDYLKVVKVEGEFPFQKTGKRKKDFDYANNMRQLGLIDLRNGRYFLTPRGQSLMIIEDVVASRHPWKNQLLKFGLLKAIADLDWNCITALLWHSQIIKETSVTLKEKFKPSLSQGNFKGHWQRIHLNLARNTDLLENYLKLYKNCLDDGRDERACHVTASQRANPYSKDFIGDTYFGVESMVTNEEAKQFLLGFLPVCLRIYETYSDNKEIGNVEPLKSLVLANSLKRNKFVSEFQISDKLLEIFVENEIPIYRVLLEMQFSGRGLFHWEKGSVEFYPDFNLHIALRNLV